MPLEKAFAVVFFCSEKIGNNVAEMVCIDLLCYLSAN